MEVANAFELCEKFLLVTMKRHTNIIQLEISSVKFKCKQEKGIDKDFLNPNTVYSGNSKRLNSEQSLISEHFWRNWAIFL